MNTFNLWKKGRMRLYTGPSCWAELTDPQSVSMMRVRSMVLEKPECLFAVLKQLYGMSFRTQRWLFDDNYLRRKGMEPDDRELTRRMGQAMLDTLTWIGQEDDTGTFPQRFRRFDFYFGTTRIWLRRLVNRTVYHGPAAALANCTFAEFMFADVAFQKRDWAKLAAILYRPAGTDGADPRQPLDRHQVEARAEAFAQLDPALLERIVFAYGCTLVRLKSFFPLVFKAPDEADTSTTQKQNSWLDVAINMVKLDATRVQEIEKLNLYLALKVLNAQIQQGEEMQEQYDNMKNR
ncbi:hypothetical protein [Spirosoma rhododendri]|uniref:Uncharacterized protein n=1 Tax=Spirosoma rhododendri TaxID=2728024 RepID=A0A7L5DPN7_9BACT|nr:hypothetical protein [Spirosoma rhododendri]QJD79552.1 hypothetical protein HH216_14870 [Spirosoma rhododendri]